MVSRSRISCFYLSTLLLASCVLARQIVLDLDPDLSSPICEESHTDRNAVDHKVDGNGGNNRLVCEGQSYVNPKTGITSCCALGTFWATDAVHPTEGKCCPGGTSYSFDYYVQNGDCCLPGQQFLKTTCRSISASSKALQATDGSCPSCGNGNVCSYNGQLGIRYNHCYTMKDSDGHQILRYLSAAPYYINQDLKASFTGARGIPFRICATSTNCSVMADQYVPVGGSWLQLDEQGLETDTANTPAWMYLASTLYLAAESTTPTPTTSPANFTGQGICIYGECGICLKFASVSGFCATTLGGLGLSIQVGAYGAGMRCVQNSRQCQPYYYEETSCIGPSNVAPN